MKHTLVRSIACCAALSMLGAASAQQSTPARPGQSSQPYGSQRQQQAMHSGQLLRSIDLIGSSVQSSQGSRIGNIRDIAINPQTGRIEFALLSLSSTLGATGAGAGATTGATTDTTRTDPGRAATTTTTPGTAVGTPGAGTTSGADSTTSAIGSSATMGRIVPVPWQLMSLRSTGAESGVSSTTTPGQSSPPGTSATPETSTTPGSISSATAMLMPTFTLNVDPSRLQSAPTLDQTGPGSALQNPSFAQRVYSHFGVNRQQSGVGGSDSGINTGTGTGTQDQQQQEQNRRDRQENQGGSQNRPPGGSNGGTSGGGTSPKP
jgi:hypothetical protein